MADKFGQISQIYQAQATCHCLSMLKIHQAVSDCYLLLAQSNFSNNKYSINKQTVGVSLANDGLL
ncbi:hypothetical protein [Moraxella cuniculi]|uniref:hypothetical protein n=1 Tax=Moraxella cuniculi TaxID=34061 RepID=UPI000F8363DC|nr:hypothetical protein [Moraxella cuniculi]